MERIQRALDLSKLHAQSPISPPVEDDTRAERIALNREFSLGVVESVGRLPVNWSACKERRVIHTEDVQAAGHAYRMLRTQVLQRARMHGLNTLGVVSAINGEGKTLTAVNLALSLAAEPNQSVVLVDFDLRRPAVARTLGLSPPQGLESWFNSDIPARSVCYGLDGVERLHVLPTLTSVAGSSEILAGLGTRKLLNELKGRDASRILIVDLPPVLLSDDALMVAPLLDGVVLVVHERRTRREDVVRVMELLGNTKIVGTVLNGASQSETRAY